MHKHAPTSPFSPSQPINRSIKIGRIAALLILLCLLASCTTLLFDSGLRIQQQPGDSEHPTLADFWAGSADFELIVEDTGLPMGESETIIMADGQWWSYVHASDRSAGIIDQCGDPVEFPGCVVIYRSDDAGQSFDLETPVCQIGCVQCPCETVADNTNQQQYPDIHFDGGTLRMVYEFRGESMVRESRDGLTWQFRERVAETGIWRKWLRPCPVDEEIGEHPFVPYDYECLAGAPPGIYVEDGTVYIFVGVGQSPGAMGCYKGSVDADYGLFDRCDNNPLFRGAQTYGPVDATGVDGNPYFDFRTVSSADIQKIGDRYYMFYEGVRGPGPGDPGDTQFGLGMARSLTDQIDGPWEKFDGNPILVDVPSNIGIGHADLLVDDGLTVLFTSLDGVTRSRLNLVWK